MWVRRATVVGTVAAIFRSKKGNVYLNFGADYPHQTFTAVALQPAGVDRRLGFAGRTAGRCARDDRDVPRAGSRSCSSARTRSCGSSPLRPGRHSPPAVPSADTATICPIDELRVRFHPPTAISLYTHSARRCASPPSGSSYVRPYRPVLRRASSVRTGSADPACRCPGRPPRLRREPVAHRTRLQARRRPVVHRQSHGAAVHRAARRACHPHGHEQDGEYHHRGFEQRELPGLTGERSAGQAAGDDGLHGHVHGRAERGSPPAPAHVRSLSATRRAGSGRWP